jgi:hypothetical protein
VSIVVFGDVENVVKSWLSTTDVAAMVTRPGGGLSIFLAMPSSAPMPCLVLRRVGGGPVPRSDLPTDRARMSFSCWGDTRVSAGSLARAVVAECDSLGRMSPWVSGPTTLYGADVLSVLWLPDPDSDKPRYIVDALVTTLTA